ncbi:proteinase-activated receptor 3-like [Latimeria chalumnae]|uniref:proteinase-activated receptor 3-like n=1 Tax=Latimeria chalumnae TaxID=7897 RepID=UPI00313CB569
MRSTAGYNVSISAAYYLTNPITTVLLPMIYVVALLGGLPMNGLALWILCTRAERKTPTIFLINLAMADFLFAFTLPFKIFYYFLGNDWRLGEYVCRIVTVAFYGNLYCSILLLMCISIYRYIGIVKPRISRVLRSRKLALSICLAVWILVSLAVIPFVLDRQSYPINGLNITACHDVVPQDETFNLQHYFTFLAVVGFFLPFLVIVFCYVSILRALLPHKNRYRYAVKLTALVMTTFIVCFTPCNFFLFVHNLGLVFEDPNTSYIAYLICLALSSLNTCIDPLTFYYANKELKSDMKRALQLSKRSKNDSLGQSLHTFSIASKV